jgi:predicted GNAT family N-acyltransferase
VKNSDIHIVPVVTRRQFAQAVALRTLVFIVEQKVPFEEEFDELDNECFHVLAMLGQRPIATARSRLYDAETGKIERIVTDSQFRGRGAASQMILYLIEDLKQKNPDLKRIWMSAQDHALSTYGKLGFVVKGDGYLDCGIPHHDVYLNLINS